MKRMYLLLVILWIAGLVQSALADDLHGVVAIDTATHGFPVLSPNFRSYWWQNSSDQVVHIKQVQVVAQGSWQHPAWVVRNSDASVVLLATQANSVLKMDQGDSIDLSPGDYLQLSVQGQDNVALLVWYWPRVTFFGGPTP